MVCDSLSPSEGTLLTRSFFSRQKPTSRFELAAQDRQFAVGLLTAWSFEIYTFERNLGQVSLLDKGCAQKRKQRYPKRRVTVYYYIPRLPPQGY